MPLPDEFRRALAPLRKPSGRLLPSFENLYREIKKACEQAGVPRFSLNDCRRTFGSWMVQRDVPVFTVSKLMGHSSPAMVQQVYGRLSEDSLRRAIKKLPRAHTHLPRLVQAEVANKRKRTSPAKRQPR